jgi:hypothetical protein
VNCAYLDGGPADDTDHHNLVVMYDGYLLLPFAPEFGVTGGMAFFDITDPCAPIMVGSGPATMMRETHSVGFSQHGGRWAVTNMVRFGDDPGGGVLFWDVSDPTAPVEGAPLALPGFGYPDAYARPTLSVFWQVPYVYVAGADNGVYIVDATDPRDPQLVGQIELTPTLRAGQVQAIGDLLIVTAAEGARAVLLDISDPASPQPIPGGDFLAHDESGMTRDAYFTNFVGGYLWFARKDAGGGLMVYDLRDPTVPTFAGAVSSAGNGGYVFVMDEYAFEGEGSFATIYDATDLANIQPVTQLHLVGDLDTLVPIGNVAVLSVDAEAEDDRGSAIAPWQLEPDTRAPRVAWSWPAPGAAGVSLTSRVGLALTEMVDVRSAWAGSVRIYPTGTDPAETRVNGYVSAQETIVNFWPYAPLQPQTEYTVEIPAGGLTDYSGNALAEPYTMTFTTGG